MGTREKVVRKGNIPHKMPVVVPVPPIQAKEKVVLAPRPNMIPA
ncbi:hypothetical protein LCGC14_2307090 [marine sediment metagenome]|uniref:Uncharacterized protein n=1 Tax=marine sediment metagenome TaxID=412755 RepID=A0A0F9FGQ6_9ZZZZ